MNTPTPPPYFFDGVLFNGHDALTEKRAEHRARIAAAQAVERERERFAENDVIRNHLGRFLPKEMRVVMPRAPQHQQREDAKNA